MTDKHAAESFEIGEPLIAFGVKPHKARSFERSSTSLSHTVSNGHEVLPSLCAVYGI